MLKSKAEYNTPEALSEELLELVAGGATPDGNGNVPICPTWPPGHPGGGVGPVRHHS